jgi:uncharacterized MAPEG superfamily protein
MADERVPDRSHNHPALSASNDPRIEQHIKWWSLVPEVILLLLMIGGDAVNLKQVVDIAFDADPFTALTLTAAVTGAAVLMMHLAGRAAAKRRAKEATFGVARLLAIVIPWLAIGFVAFAIRLTSEESLRLVGETIENAVTGSESTTGLSSKALLAALLMLSIYIASGIVAFHLGYEWYSPHKNELKTLQRRLKEAQAEHRAALEALRLKQGEVVSATNLRDQSDAIRDAIAVQIAAEAEQMKEQARLLIAAKLGEPAKTSGVTREVSR